MSVNDDDHDSEVAHFDQCLASRLRGGGSEGDIEWEQLFVQFDSIRIERGMYLQCGATHV